MLRGAALVLANPNASRARLCAYACVFLLSFTAPAAPAHAQCDAKATEEADCAAECSVLIVQARVAMLGGAQPGPGMPPAAPHYETLTGVPVQVRATDAPDLVVAEELTDVQGLASFPDLAPGAYWVVIPQSAPSSALSDAISSSLPDGLRVLAAMQATLPDTGALNLTLTAVVPLP